MSLDKRKTDTKPIKLEGTKEDFTALADVIDSASKRIGLDLNPDVPKEGKIHIKGTAKIPQFIYPRLKKALKELSEGLRGEGDAVVDFGYIPFNDYTTEEIILKSPTLRLMNQIGFGKEHGLETIIKEKDVVDDFANMIDITKFRGSKTFLTDAKGAWVHAESVLVDESSRTITHPFMGEVKIPGKRKLNQAYFVVMKVDKILPLKTEIRTHAGLWDSWINSRPNPATMRLYSGQPPRNIGSFLERFAVYCAARTFDMDNAFLAPWDTSKGIRNPAGYNFEDRIYVEGPIRTRGVGGKDIANFYGFLVVGHGGDKRIGLGEKRRRDEGDIMLPGLP